MLSVDKCGTSHILCFGLGAFEKYYESSTDCETCLLDLHVMSHYPQTMVVHLQTLNWGYCIDYSKCPQKIATF